MFQKTVGINLPIPHMLCDFTDCNIGELGVLITYMLTASILSVVGKRKSEEIPLVTEWLAKVRYLGLMNKLSAICIYRTGQENAIENFTMQWGLFWCSNYVGYQIDHIKESILSVL